MLLSHNRSLHLCSLLCEVILQLLPLLSEVRLQQLSLLSDKQLETEDPFAVLSGQLEFAGLSFGKSLALAQLLGSQLCFEFFERLLQLLLLLIGVEGVLRVLRA